MSSEQRPGPVPRSFDEIRELGMTPEDEALLEREKEEAAAAGFSSVPEFKKVRAAQAAARGAQKAQESPLEAAANHPGVPGEIPPWVVVPQALRFPRNRQVSFLRIPSDWTTDHSKGLVYPGEDPKAGRYAGKRHRQCILWSLSIADEKLARNAARGEPLAVYSEMAKRMVRAIDGHFVSWETGDVQRDGDLGHVPTFWEDIGPAARSLLVNHYHSTHALSKDQINHFFLGCVVTLSSVG